MSVLYTPRRPRRLRLHKSIPRGRRLRRVRPVGSVGNIYATGFGNLTWRRLEAGRRLLTRQLRRSKVRVRTRLNQPLTAKSKHARMGKGKGKLRGWSGYVRPGTLMYVVEPTPRKSWLRHRSPTTRLLGLFPFGRLNYKYSGGMAAVQRSGLAPWREGNRRPRPHYPQRQRPLRLRPAHRSGRGSGLLNPWQFSCGPAQGLGLWLGHRSPSATPELQRLLANGGEGLLRGFLVGRRRAGYPPLGGEETLRRLLQQRQRQRRHRHRQRLVTKLLKRLPQHWRRCRGVLGGLLENCWRRLETIRPRRLSGAGGHQRGLLLTLQGLELLLQSLQQLERRGDGAALRLLPRNYSDEILWPPQRGEGLYQLNRRGLRLRRRCRLPLTSLHPTTSATKLQRLEEPTRRTPGRLRRWLRRNWLIDWYNWLEREKRSFPSLEEELYRGNQPPTPETWAAAHPRLQRLRRRREEELRSYGSSADVGFSDGGEAGIGSALDYSSFSEGSASEYSDDETTFPGVPSPEINSSAEGSAEPTAAAAEESGSAETSGEGEDFRRRPPRLTPEELEQQQLLEEELLLQQLLEEPEGGEVEEGGEDPSQELPPRGLNLELPTLPTAAQLSRWRFRSYRARSPWSWSALQRRLATRRSQRRLLQDRTLLEATARLGSWLAGGDDASALLQRHQWRQKLAQWGLTLHWRQPAGALALGTPHSGVLGLATLRQLLQRLLRRRSSLGRGLRRWSQRRRRLRRRSRRRQRIKARRRRFWRLTHRRRWFWWQRRSRRRRWRWNPRLIIRRNS